MRYPTFSGLAVHPYELEFTKTDQIRRATTNHHIYFCKEQYQRSRVAQAFRGLETHVVPLFISEHDNLHREFSPPKMPHEGLMIDVLDEYLSLNGVLNIVRERKTNTQYQIHAAEWQQIRKGYGR